MIKSLKHFFHGSIKEKNKNNKISNYIVSYMIVILISTFVMTALVYRYINKKTELQIINTNHSALLNYKNTIDTFVLKSIDNISLMILNENNLFTESFKQSLLNHPATIINLHNQINNYASMNPIIEDISVYYKNSNAVISTKGIHYLDEDMNSLTNKKAPHRDIAWIPYMNSMDNFYNWMETRSVRCKENYENSFVNVITLLRKYPFSYNEYLGGIAISINESKLKSLIQNSVPSYMNQIIILNNNNTIISHDDKSFISKNVSDLPFGEKLLNTNNGDGNFVYLHNGEKVIVSYVSSSYNNWKYISVNYINQFAENYQFIRLVILYFIITIFIIFLLALFLSVKRILFANKKVTTLSSIVEKQEKELEKNQDIVRHNFYINLINGIFQKEIEITNQMELLKIDFPYSFYISTVIKLYGENAADLRTIEYTRLKIIDYTDILFEDIDINCMCTIINKNIVLVLNIPDDNFYFKHIIEKIYDYTLSTLGFKCCIGIGEICNTPINITCSYKEALDCMEYGYFLCDQSILDYNEVKKLENRKNRISREYMERFVTHLNLRNKKEAMDCIHELEKDVAQGIYSYHHTMATLREFIATLDTAMQQRQLYFKCENNEYSDLYYHFNRCETLNDFVILVEDVLDNYLMNDDINSNMKNKELVEQIKHYISTNIVHEAISLTTIADAMHISPNYLSRIFKEETGMCFIDYLIEAKLEMSKDLLANSDMTIESIAEAAGYNSTMYYSRKFKARYGLTPKQYRTKTFNKPKIKNHL